MGASGLSTRWHPKKSAARYRNEENELGRVESTGKSEIRLKTVEEIRNES